jgi:hypothetical protein
MASKSSLFLSHGLPLTGSFYVALRTSSLQTRAWALVLKPGLHFYHRSDNRRVQQTDALADVIALSGKGAEARPHDGLRRRTGSRVWGCGG